MFKLIQISGTDAKIVFLSSKIIYVTAISFLTALSQTKLDEKQIVDHNRSEYYYILDQSYLILLGCLLQLFMANLSLTLQGLVF